jgi:hypothetical protein
MREVYRTRQSLHPVRYWFHQKLFQGNAVTADQELAREMECRVEGVQARE